MLPLLELLEKSATQSRISSLMKRQWKSGIYLRNHIDRMDLQADTAKLQIILIIGD